MKTIFMLQLTAISATMMCGSAIAEHADNHAPASAEKSAQEHPAPVHHEAPHWSYGPHGWGDLDPAFAACSKGMAQSPIDFSGPVEAALTSPKLDYKPLPLVVMNNGHTVQVPSSSTNTLSLNGDTYKLLQLHFHTPSEHTVDGKAYPMEVHLVHKNDKGELAVLGIFFAEGAANPAVEQIIAAAPAHEGQNAVEKTMLDLSQLMPKSVGDMRPHVLRYNGSLTTPPCSEGVKWMVMRQPVTASAEQLAAMRALMGYNARPTQPLNNRMVLDLPL